MDQLVLDAGALILADRGDPRVRTWIANAASRGLVPIVPAVVIAQAWRGPTSAPLAQLLRAVYIVPVDASIAKSAGQLLAISRTADAIDAIVVTLAAMTGGTILTTDPVDMTNLAAHVTNVRIAAL